MTLRLEEFRNSSVIRSHLNVLRYRKRYLMEEETGLYLALYNRIKLEPDQIRLVEVAPDPQPIENFTIPYTGRGIRRRKVRGGNAEDTDFYNYYSGRVERKGGKIDGRRKKVRDKGNYFTDDDKSYMHHSIGL